MTSALNDPMMEKQETLSTFVRLLPVAVAMFDRDMRYIAASDRWCTDYGLHDGDIIGKSHYEIFPEIPEEWRALHRLGLAGESLRKEEDLFERADGHTMWLRWEIRPWGARNGVPAGILIYSEDITERKRAQDALLQLGKAYRDLTDNSPDAIVRFGRDGRYVFVNTHFLHACGLPEEAFIGRLAGAVVPHNPAGPLWRDAIGKVVAEGRTRILEFPFRMQENSDDETIWEARFVPEFAGGGSVQSVLMIATDRTAHRLAQAQARRGEDAVRERESIITTLFETASQGIIAVGLDARIQLANRMAEEVFGYAPGELVGKPHDVLLPEPLRAKHAMHHRQFMLAPKKRTMGQGIELQGRRKDGSMFPIEVSLSHVDTARGLLAVAFVTDITLRVNQQRALEEGQQELRKLSNALLVAEQNAARRIARELHDDITQRLAFLSMEIGKTAVRLHDDAAAVQELRSHQGKILQISDSVRRISHEMHPSVLDDLGLAAAIESLCLDFQKYEGIPVRFTAHEIPDAVDETIGACLYRVTQESLHNITRHAQAAAAQVSLERQGDHLQLQIVDDGMGFDTSSRKPGLGTLSTQERVRLVNGAVSVESAPGKGTCVTVRVPIEVSTSDPRSFEK